MQANLSALCAWVQATKDLHIADCTGAKEEVLGPQHPLSSQPRPQLAKINPSNPTQRGSCYLIKHFHNWDLDHSDPLLIPCNSGSIPSGPDLTLLSRQNRLPVVKGGDES